MHDIVLAYLTIPWRYAVLVTLEQFAVFRAKEKGVLER